MKKTFEQLRDEYISLMTENGFEATGTATWDGNTILAREWTGTYRVAFYGERTGTFRITTYIDFGYPIISIYRNGLKRETRDYSSPKRALNAIREIVRHEGYTL